MRKVDVFLCGVCLVLATTVAAGPLDKGSSIVGGQFSFINQSGNLYEYDGSSQSTLLVTPFYGRFLSPGLMIGGHLNLISTKQGRYENTVWTMGPRVVYYFGAENERKSIRGAVFPHLGFQLSLGKRDPSYTITEIGAEFGLLMMMSDAIGADFVAIVSRDKVSLNGASVSGTTVIVGVGISAFLF